MTDHRRAKIRRRLEAELGWVLRQLPIRWDIVADYHRMLDALDQEPSGTEDPKPQKPPGLATTGRAGTGSP